MTNASASGHLERAVSILEGAIAEIERKADQHEGHAAYLRKQLEEAENAAHSARSEAAEIRATLTIMKAGA